MNKHYPFNIEWSEEDQEFKATCPAFPGLSAFGESEEEALKEAKVALAGFIETCEASNIPLPEVADHTSFSGKLQLRLPRSLHKTATEMASQEAVSLNTYIADAVRARVTGEQVAKPMIEEMRRHATATQRQVESVLTVPRPARYTEKTSTTEISLEAEHVAFTGGSPRRDH